MKTFYKIFLVLFILFLGINIYAINWRLSFWHEDNTKFIFSIAASLLGIIVVYILDTWSKLADKKQ